MGTWLQVEFLQSMLDRAIAAAPSDEADLRRTLRDQAQFLLLEFDDADAQLQRNLAQVSQPVELRNNAAVRRLLSQVRTTVSRLLADLCAREPCEPGP